jgi:CheY-like chemotaxis protein
MLRKPRVLVADDNVALREVVRFNLEHAGYDVATACNGHEALEWLRTEEFDLVITDQQMPELTGYQLCQHLLADPRHAKTPVVMLTAKGLELDVQALVRDLGIREVIVKPFSPQELVQTVNNCLAVPLVRS